MPEHLPGLLSSLDEVAASNDPDLIAVGFITYEAGVWLEGSTAFFRRPEGTPLASFGVFRLHDAARSAPAHGDADVTWEEDSRATPEASLSQVRWAEGVETIREGIERGDVYQVNLTRRLRFRGRTDPFCLAGALYRENPVPFAVTLAGDSWAVVSNSPELFLDADFGAGQASSAPIKGTVARGRRPREDAAARERLLASAKDGAEHVMIVDLVRNDLGRVAVPGGVSVPAFRTVRTFRHLHHLESTVAARLRSGARPSDVLGALLPGGSITGAPKRAALRFIRSGEPCPRGVYTGAVGYVRGDGRVVFNVAIRTAILHDGVVDYHAGGGIVWDSLASDEWAETRTKSREFRSVVLRTAAAFGAESGR